jgi:hypothetical protein
VALGVILGSAVAALCCFGLLTAPDGDTAHADEVLPQAMSGVSAAAGHLAAARPVANGAAAAGDVPPAPTTTTTPTTALLPTTTQPPPPVTTTTPPRPTLTAPVLPTFPRTVPQPPTFPQPPTTTGRHHCHRNFC